MQKSFSSVLPKRIDQVLLQMYNKSSQRQPAKHKETARDKISKRSLLFSLKKTWKQRGGAPASEKWLQLIKVVITPLINHLS